jgi:mono/diheme cytochrome c family protein
MKYLIVYGLLGLGLYIPMNSSSDEQTEDSQKVTDLEISLGRNLDSKKPNLNIKDASAQAGEEIVKTGFGETSKGKKTKKQSKHFVCTSCHNIVKEDPNLLKNDPEARLTYTVNQGIPYLQGTTLYGAVNRNTYYNGDYYKKYGSLVDKARNDVREAIQLCAVECAQGRKLKPWEIESVLAYLWTIGLKVSDLDLNSSEKDMISKSSKSSTDKTLALEMIRGKYLDYSDATFTPPPSNRKTGNGLLGDAKNGYLFYKQSCLHCHYQQRYSYLHLDESGMSRAYLRNAVGTYHNNSIYQVTRWGVPPKNGKRSYMPQYTSQKMSEQQLADLLTYLEKGVPNDSEK